MPPTNPSDQSNGKQAMADQISGSAVPIIILFQIDQDLFFTSQKQNQS